MESIRRLALMLEGQVAVLAAGLLDSERTIELLRALRASDLYRADERSYLLYPDRDLGAFLGRGVIDEKTVAASPAMAALLARGGEGCWCARSTEAFDSTRTSTTATTSRARSTRPGSPPRPTPSSTPRYEEVFDHEAFPGRSMTFFGYEGLGASTGT